MTIRAILISAVLLTTSGCGLETVQDMKAQRTSQERYRKCYERSGGFDPISKTVGQKMQ